MVVLLACLSFLLTFGGGATVISGAAMIRQESGTALISVGATVVCSGLLLAGLTAILKELRRMRRLMELEELLPSPHGLSHAPGAPAPARPAPVATPAQSPRRPGPETAPETAPDPDGPAATRDEEPLPPAPAAEPRDGGANLPEQPVAEARAKAEPARDTRSALAPLDPSPADLSSIGSPPEGPGPAERGTRPPAAVPFPTGPSGAGGGGGLPAEARASLAGYAGLAKTRPPDGRERIGPAAASKPALDPAAAAPESRETGGPGADGAGTTASAAQRTMLTSYRSGDMTYFMYSDGSIEADLPDGRRRFRAVEELRAFAETGQGGELVGPAAPEAAQA